MFKPEQKLLIDGHNGFQTIKMVVRFVHYMDEDEVKDYETTRLDCVVRSGGILVQVDSSTLQPLPY